MQSWTWIGCSPDWIGLGPVDGRFVKQEKMGTLASPVEIGVWVQAPGALADGYYPPPEKKLYCICKFMKFSEFLAGKWFAGWPPR